MILRAVLVIAAVAVSGGVLFGIYLFCCKAKGSWRARLKMFGGGT